MWLSMMSHSGSLWHVNHGGAGGRPTFKAGIWPSTMSATMAVKIMGNTIQIQTPQETTSRVQIPIHGKMIVVGGLTKTGARKSAT